MESADLIVANGLGLEEGLQAHLENARAEGVPVLEVGEHIDPLQYGEGESAGQPDPHFWTDPARMIAAVDAVVDALEETGGLGEEIRAGAEAYRAQLEDLDAEITTTLEDIPPERRKLVTNHHVFGYLADRYGFEVIGAVLPSGTTLASPSAADLRNLSEAITEAGVPAIFADSSQPQRLAEVLAEETGLDVEIVPLYSESLTEPGDEAGTYIDMQRVNATRMAEALTRNP
jgi:zinc/manganese transport system substrate-binding protein